MPWLDNTAHAALGRSDPQHYVGRKGRKLRLRVLAVGDNDEHGHVLIFGDELRDNCLVRIHSRCLYGEVLRSDDCDCGSELDMALDFIQDAGAGVLIYLEQEGRGAGLIAKARGYQHGERTGADTFASYLALGYPADLRTYDDAVAMLVALGLRSVRLLTNNPEKVAAVRAAGLQVDLVPLHTSPRSERARRYLEAKRVRGHQLPSYNRPRLRLRECRSWLRSRTMSVVIVAVMMGAMRTLSLLAGRRRRAPSNPCTA
ncbi:MAG: cyclohydrolase-2 [Nocardia sp.]|uniref:GTP cyclohydrolase II n=1 Tax=Nocardia sp. TaxID=1821 RepID=UPI00262258B4|nr:GTP cyclohydrolase II [Nocardia sp.]MCU1640511.1 cyclohydrolase-2 [Nocardia sp.]